MDRKTKLSELNLYQRRKYYDYFFEFQKVVKENRESLKGIRENQLTILLQLLAFNLVDKPMSSFGAIEYVYNKEGLLHIRWVSNDEDLSVEGEPGSKLEDIEPEITAAIMDRENILLYHYNEWKTCSLEIQIPPSLDHEVYYAFAKIALSHGPGHASLALSKDRFWEK